MGKNPLDLSGRTAAVIGGTSGLGRAIAHGLAQAGADVVATSRRAETVTSTADEIESLGRRTLRVATDVTDAESVKALLGACVDEFGGVDVLVNSAGTTKKIAALEMDMADWNRIIDVNLTGTLRSCLIFGEHMLERGRGRIINIASLASFVGLYQVVAYGASKAAFLRLAGVLAVEHAGSGVRFMNLEPGFVMTEAMRLNDPDGELEKFQVGAPMSVPASVIAWLASDPAAEKYNGRLVEAQPLCLELGLQPDWRPA